MRNKCVCGTPLDDNGNCPAVFTEKDNVCLNCHAPLDEDGYCTMGMDYSCKINPDKCFECGGPLDDDGFCMEAPYDDCRAR